MDYRILFIAPLAALVLSVNSASAQLPTGWMPLSQAMTTNPGQTGLNGYEIGIDPASNASRSRELTVRSTQPLRDEPPSVGAAWQQAFGYAGQRVRFSGQIRAQGVHVWAGLYMGAGDGQLLSRLALGQPGAQKHPPMGAGVAAGTTGWQDVSVVIDVPADALSINLGLALVGEGQVWARNLHFETVGADAPVSTAPIGIDWASAHELSERNRRLMAAAPPQPLANATLD